MSLKTAFAAVLKAIRGARGLSQKKLAEVSSRTYVSKLERGQSSPTLEMMTALSEPLNLSPLTLVAMTIAAETGHSIKALISRVEDEVSELASAGVLRELKVAHGETMPTNRFAPHTMTKHTVRVTQQTEFTFTDQSAG